MKPNWSSVLYIVAHPDDEDPITVTALASAGIRVGLFSLTRGEGGENRVGSERAERLGARRTAELQAACDHYGVGWLGFSRAVDYGYSRLLDEARERWDEDLLLEDLLLAVDQFAPAALICRFAGQPVDGHAHHQLCGELTGVLADRTDLELWVGDPSAADAQLLVSEISEVVRGRALAGYKQHVSQGPELLLSHGVDEPVRYRQVRRGARAASGDPERRRATGPFALPVVRDEGASMYRWRDPSFALRPWMPAGDEPVIRGVPECVLACPKEPVSVALGDFEVADAGGLAARRTGAGVELVAPTAGRYRVEISEAVREHDVGVVFREPASIVVVAGDVQRVPRVVAYVPGFGADPRPSLEQLCERVELIDTAAQLASTDAPVIVIGAMAYPRHDWLAESSLPADLARAGRHVVVFGQGAPFCAAVHSPFEGELPERPAEACEEGGSVRLVAHSTVLTQPHRIGPADFNGWIEQRGSKFWSSWDRRLTALVEVQDRGEAPETGVWLTAPVGAGVYTYCALALPRQLDHGVVGAYRILANLLALQSR